MPVKISAVNGNSYFRVIDPKQQSNADVSKV
jgi:hypothetical protein